MHPVLDVARCSNFSRKQCPRHQAVIGQSASSYRATGEKATGTQSVAGQGMRNASILFPLGGQLPPFVANPRPDHAEVEFGLLSTLQYELEACLALIGHPVLIVLLQDPLLLRCEH